MPFINKVLCLIYRKEVFLLVEALIEIDSLVKIYPPSTIAVKDFDLKINTGEIHSVIGENGAGKSTLMKMIYGLTERSSGKIKINNRDVKFTSPQQAVKYGIGMVHQEFMLIPSYTVFENIILGVEPTSKLGIIEKKEAEKKIKDLIKQYNFNLKLKSKISEISVAAQQKVEILKLLYRDVDVLILDEPTAVLTPQEIEDLFLRLKKLRYEGRTIIFISHKLDEVLELSDVITVMRKGEKITTLENNNLGKAELAKAMVGRDVIFSIDKTKANLGDVIFSAVNLNYKDANGIQQLEDVSLQINSGEILGVAGVEGNGQYELVRAISGLLDLDYGEIKIKNKNIEDLDILKRRREMAYVTQDRKFMGSAQDLNLMENSIMTHHRLNDELSYYHPVLLSKSASIKFADNLINKFKVISESSKQPISSLSGGNQQRLIVGREFMLSDQFIMLDNPTRGLDVGSIEFIQEEIINKRDKGAAVLLVSADLDELFSLADRLLVMHSGKVVFNTDTARTNKEEIGQYMLGAEMSDSA